MNMPPVFDHKDLAYDLKLLSKKYLSIHMDVDYIRNLIREDARFGRRCQEFHPDRVFRIDIAIAALGPFGQDRCCLVYERDGNECHFWLVYDNEGNRWGQDIMDRVNLRRNS